MNPATPGLPGNRTKPRLAAKLLGRVFLLALIVSAVIFVGQTFTFGQTMLHEESSATSGVTYEYAGSPYASELYLMEVSTLTGPRYELRIGPHAALEYYPVEVRFGSGEPRIRTVNWQPDKVVVSFESGETVNVPADNFRSVR